MSNLSADTLSPTISQLISHFGDLSHASVLLLLAALTLSALGLRLLQTRLARQKVQKLERQAQQARLLATSNAQARMLEQVQARLQTLEAYVDLLSGKQEQLLSNGTVRKHRLQDAIDFAGRGLDGQEIARRAGVNGSEARLIGELYGINAA